MARRESTKAILFVVVWLASLGGMVVGGSVVFRHQDSSFGPRDMTLTVEGGAWTITYQTTSSNATAFRLLREANVTMGFELRWVDYGWPYDDVFVTSINGTRNDQARDLWWQYCVDGTYASSGAASQEVREGDVIAWVYGPPGGNGLCH